MNSLSLDTGLWRSGILVGQSHNEITGWYSLDDNAAAPCLDDDYVGTAHAHLVPPYGYEPLSADEEVVSPVVWVSC
jgi:hypothetical protein